MCSECLQPFWISWKLVVPLWCNSVINQKGPYNTWSHSLLTLPSGSDIPLNNTVIVTFVMIEWANSLSCARFWQKPHIHSHPSLSEPPTVLSETAVKTVGVIKENMRRQLMVILKRFSRLFLKSVSIKP